MTGQVRPATSSEHRQDDGFALLTVLGSMTIITLFLLSSLAYAMHNSQPSRADQDSKSALAAAQAGIDEFLSQLNADPTYYENAVCTTTGNQAFCPVGVPVYGAGANAARFRYEVLTTATDTALDGIIRLKVTGSSRGEERDLTATLTPDGFLKYIYFTDFESGDPAMQTGLAVRHNGDASRLVEVNTGATKWIQYQWYATDSMLETVCKTHYYAGRHAGEYTVGAYVEVATGYKNNGDLSGYSNTETKQADPANRITLGCQEIQFTANDIVNGPLHSNDALRITGLADFKDSTATSWGSGASLAPPTDGKLWWGDKTLTLPGQKPQYAPVLNMPASNDKLRKKANPLTPDFGPGCLYTGQTRITFVGNKMKVLSPGTASSVARCYNTSARNTEQLLDIPPVIYVQDGPCGTAGVGYPRLDLGEDVTKSWSIKYDCSYGTAFVSGVLQGRVTIGTSRDVVVVGDTTYQNELNGSDALGLIPQGFAWVYHPVKSDDSNVLTTPVRKIDAAILSVQHSFLTQNYFRGAALSTSTDESSKLRVRGSILQKHRGPVGSPAVSAGYLKNYIYDERLLNAPPPFFLNPDGAPWRVVNVTD